MEKLKKLVKKNKVVVFDVETTGLRNNAITGEVDYIIEIAAVKIKRGKICDKFSSFVACPEELDECITALTGITNKDLNGAPEISEVLRKFYDFCEDCILVAYNLSFNYGFIRHYGERYEIFFPNQKFDISVLAKETLSGRVENYKLSTLARFFKIKFDNHRASMEAETTAEILLKLADYEGDNYGITKWIKRKTA